MTKTEVKQDIDNDEEDDFDDRNDVSEKDSSEYIYDGVVHAVDESGNTVYLKQEVMEVEDEDLAKTLEGDEVVVVMLEYDPDQENGGEGEYMVEQSEEGENEGVKVSKKLQELKFNESVAVKVPEFKWGNILMCDKCGDLFRSLKQLFQHK